MVLADEVANDPLVRGYSGMTDQELVDSLNTADRSRNRTSMTRSEIMQAVVPAAYNALAGDDLVAFWGLLSVETLNPFGVEADVMIDIFGSGSATITALGTARVESISRAVEVGAGVITLGTLKMQSIR